MNNINKSPRNKKHFSKLVNFASKIIKLCKKAKITPILYGSAAHFIHTQDTSVKINDIDLWIREKEYPQLIKELKNNKINYEYVPKWHTLIIKIGKLRVEIDSIDFWYRDLKNKPLPRNFDNFSFNGRKIKIIDLKGLENLYLIAYQKTKDNKKKIIDKIKHLEKFLERKLKAKFA